MLSPNLSHSDDDGSTVHFSLLSTHWFNFDRLWPQITP